MPTCDPILLTPVSILLTASNAKRVLDIGVGYGKWGLLVREYIDCWRNNNHEPARWATNLTGIEIFSRYKNPVWDIYDRILIGNAFEEIKKLEDKSFDLCIMIDVLEHFSKEQGLELLSQIARVSHKMIASYSNCDQSGISDNKNEDHLSKWSVLDFIEYNLRLVDSGGNWGLLSSCG